MTATRRDSAPAGIEELRDLIGRTPLIEIRLFWIRNLEPVSLVKVGEQER